LVRYETQTKKHIESPVLEQALLLLPPHLQAGGKCRCRQMSPLLPLQPYPGKTGIYMETDGSGALKPDRQDIPKIDSTRCSGCGRCVAACPLRLITLEVSGFRKSAVLSNAELCTRCGLCVESCLLDAIIEK